MGRCRILYAIRDEYAWYLKGFDGKEFKFTDCINEAKMWDISEEPKELLETYILGCECLPDCVLVRIKVSEYEEVEEQLTHQHEDKGESYE